MDIFSPGNVKKKTLETDMSCLSGVVVNPLFRPNFFFFYINKYILGGKTIAFGHCHCLKMFSLNYLFVMLHIKMPMVFLPIYIYIFQSINLILN